MKLPVRQSTRKPVIGVMGPAKAGSRELSDAKTLGELIARQRWVVLTGGRASGVMDAASEGAKSVPGSLTIGILPDGKAQVSRYVDVAIVTDLGQARSNMNVERHVQRYHRGLWARRYWNGLRSCLTLKAKKTVILLEGDKRTGWASSKISHHILCMPRPRPKKR